MIQAKSHDILKYKKGGLMPEMKTRFVNLSELTPQELWKISECRDASEETRENAAMLYSMLMDEGMVPDEGDEDLGAKRATEWTFAVPVTLVLANA